MATTGAAQVDIDVVDLTTLMGQSLKGIMCVQGPTLRGKVGKAGFAGSWPEFVRKWGGLFSGSDFPLYCKRLLDSGSKLYVSRAGHFLNISDFTTLEGTAATVTGTNGAVVETLATATITITSAGAAASTVTAKVQGVTIGSYTFATSDTPTLVATGLRANINANTSTNGGYTAAGTTTNVIVTAPVGSGAGANSRTVSVVFTGTMAGTTTQFTGGVTAVTACSTAFAAENIGDGYNGTTITVQPAASGNAGKVDVTYTIPGVDIPEVYKDVTKALGAPEKAIINDKSNNVTIGVVTTELPYGTFTLSAGVQVISNITVTDYIGDSNSSTGLHSFDPIVDSTRIGNLGHFISNPLDVALQAYVENRGDMVGFITTPVGLDDDAIVAYRQRTAPYTTGASINSAYMAMFTGGLNVLDPNSSTNRDISEIADVGGIFAKKDSKQGEWFTGAGSKRGKITNANGVVYNMGSPALLNSLSLVDSNGVNAVINHPAFGLVLWGNNTLQKEQTLLQDLNIAELVIFIKRTVKPLIESELFDPNDFVTWRNIYRKVKPFAEKLKDQRAIFDYKYYGDQDADTLSDLVINNPDDVQGGLYKINFLIKPIGALKWVKMSIGLINASVSFDEISESEFA